MSSLREDSDATGAEPLSGVGGNRGPRKCVARHPPATGGETRIAQTEAEAAAFRWLMEREKILPQQPPIEASDRGGTRRKLSSYMMRDLERTRRIE